MDAEVVIVIESSIVYHATPTQHRQDIATIKLHSTTLHLIALRYTAL